MKEYNRYHPEMTPETLAEFGYDPQTTDFMLRYSRISRRYLDEKINVEQYLKLTDILRARYTREPVGAGR